MAKLELREGSSNQYLTFAIEKADGTGPYTGLTWDTPGLVAAYSRQGANALTDIVLASKGVGDSNAGGFVEVDAVKAPGIYELAIPNTAIVAGTSNTVRVYMSGAANMAPVRLEVHLTKTDWRDGAQGGMSFVGDVQYIRGTRITVETNTGIMSENFRTFFNNDDAASTKKQDDVGGGGGGGLTQQDVRDAMTLATVETPATGSIDDQLGKMPGEVDAALSAAHGAGSWLTADTSGLALETSVQSVLTTGGAGPWGTADVSGLALESSVQSIISTGGAGPWTTYDGGTIESQLADLHAAEVTGVTQDLADRAAVLSGVGMILVGGNSDTTTNLGAITAFKPDGSEFGRYTAPVDPDADNLVGVRAQ